MDILPFSKTLLIFGILFGFLSVAFGAFGAHALKTKLTTEYLNVFEVGVRYQMVHALLLILIACIFQYHPTCYIQIAGFLTIAGIIIFSGSLYLLALTGITKWGAVTPVGGLFLLFGWLLLLIGVIK